MDTAGDVSMGSWARASGVEVSESTACAGGGGGWLMVPLGSGVWYMHSAARPSCAQRPHVGRSLSHIRRDAWQLRQDRITRLRRLGFFWAGVHGLQSLSGAITIIDSKQSLRGLCGEGEARVSRDGYGQLLK